MKNKKLLLSRVSEAPFTTGAFGVESQGAEFGTAMDVISGMPRATVVVEQTTDGGASWQPVITFDLDRQGEFSTPAGAQIQFEGNALRARLDKLEGGQAYITLWSK